MKNMKIDISILQDMLDRIDELEQEIKIIEAENKMLSGLLKEIDEEKPSILPVILIWVISLMTAACIISLS